jgi:hypothetical protein
VVPDIGDMLNALWSGTIKMPGEIYAGERAPTVADTTSFALNTLPVRGVLGKIKAYHGSPYDFPPEPGAPLGRFRDDKIGTGEGVQAYAYGHYSGEREGTARSYRDTLAKPDAGDPVGNAWDLLYNYNQSRPELLEHFDTLFNASSDPVKRKFYQDSINAIESGAVDKYKPPGKMYELNIKAEPEQFLDWDKPATAQPPNVIDALNKIWQERGGTLEGRQYLPFAAHPEATGESLHSALAATLGSKEAAAAALRDAGVPGVRYLDQNSRRFPAMYQADLAKAKAEVNDLSGALKTTQDALRSVDPGSRAHNSLSLDALNHSSNLETAQARLDRLLQNPVEATSNYVVFDPKIIEILRKYGIMGPVAGAGLLGAAEQQ